MHSVLIAQQLRTHVLSMFCNFFCWLLNFRSITTLRYLTLSFKHVSKFANVSAQFKAFNVPTALYGHMKKKYRNIMSLFSSAIYSPNASVNYENMF